MNSQLAVGVTLLLASVSGFAIWQDDAHAAAPPAPVVAPAVSSTEQPAVLPTGQPVAPWLAQALRRWLDHELTIDLHRGERSLTLQVRWREREPIVAGGAR